jgi:hypothetical protein
MTPDYGNNIRELIKAEAVKSWVPDNLASQAGQPWNEAVHGPAAKAYAAHYDKEQKWLAERAKRIKAAYGQGY